MSAAPDAAEVVLCLATAPDAATAERIGGALVEERLIACANLVPGVVSLYRWEGEVRREGEVMLLMKTRRALVGALKERLPALHPYAVPELLVCGVRDGLAPYVGWVLEETAELDRGRQDRMGRPSRGTFSGHGSDDDGGRSRA